MKGFINTHLHLRRSRFTRPYIQLIEYPPLHTKQGEFYTSLRKSRQSVRKNAMLSQLVSKAADDKGAHSIECYCHHARINSRLSGRFGYGLLAKFR